MGTELDCEDLRKGRDSPCIAVCTTLYTNICRGCGRTATEVAKWSTYTEEEKTEIWNKLERQRKADAIFEEWWDELVSNHAGIKPGPQSKHWAYLGFRLGLHTK